MSYYCYVLVNEKTYLYKGITNNLERRVKEHNENKSKGTRGKGPWRLVYFEKFEDRKKAREREKYFKSGVGREKLKKIMVKLTGQGR